MRKSAIGVRRPGIVAASAVAALAVVLGVLVPSDDTHLVAQRVGADTGAGVASGQGRGLAVGTRPSVPVNPDPWATPLPAAVAQQEGSGTFLSDEQRADFIARFGSTAALALSDLDGHTVEVLGSDGGAPYAWSTAKVLAATALLEAAGEDQLEPEEQEAMALALTESDNDALAEVIDAVGRRTEADFAGVLDYITELLRSSGDTSTTAVATDSYSLGETQWRLGDQAEFLAGVARGCVLAAEPAAQLLQTMGAVVEEQRWGLGQAESPAFKGGWDFDEDGRAYVRQFGLMTAADGNEYVAAVSIRGVADDADPETGFEQSEATLTAMAQWLREAVVTAPEATKACVN